jgi:hypothetical protein
MKPLIVLIIGIRVVFAEAARGVGIEAEVKPTIWANIHKSNPVSSVKEKFLSGWRRKIFQLDDIESFNSLAFGLLLLLFLLVGGLAYLTRGRQHRTSRKGVTQASQRPILVAMASFTFLSLLLLTALHLHLSSSTQHEHLSTTWIFGPHSSASAASNQEPTYTLSPEVDTGQNVLPNIKDPEAINPQAICPGYKAADVRYTQDGSFTANLHLAGKPCNLYGNDIEHLILEVEFQASDRLHIEIKPRYIGRENETWFLLPDVLVPRPRPESWSEQGPSDFEVEWSNEPTFSLTVKRRETGDILFSTEGTVLVYEDQFVEFVSSLPENYNLYGLGEVIHGFRLGNNLTSRLSLTS